MKSVNEILAMCYFNYLEQRKYLDSSREYLYGALYLAVEHEFNEPVLLFLEMLKIFFPAGLEIAPLKTH